MGALSFTGRLLFAAIFLMSAADKLMKFDTKTHTSPVVDYMTPHMDRAVRFAEAQLGTQLPIAQAQYPALLMLATSLELAGAVLFTLGSQLGVLLLLAFMLPVTAVMHTSWVGQPLDDPANMMDLINFQKNLAMIGALLIFLGKRQ